MVERYGEGDTTRATITTTTTKQRQTVGGGARDQRNQPFVHAALSSVLSIAICTRRQVAVQQQQGMRDRVVPRAACVCVLLTVDTRPQCFLFILLPCRTCEHRRIGLYLEGTDEWFLDDHEYWGDMRMRQGDEAWGCANMCGSDMYAIICGHIYVWTESWRGRELMSAVGLRGVHLSVLLHSHLGSFFSVLVADIPKNDFISPD